MAKENIYSNFAPASCLPDCWCEMPRVGEMILEPGNTWSNLAFVFCGLFVLWLKDEIPNRKLLSFGFVFLGAGSMAFHATQTFIGQTLDVFGMYFLVSIFIFQLWSRRFNYLYFSLFQCHFPYRSLLYSRPSSVGIFSTCCIFNCFGPNESFIGIST